MCIKDDLASLNEVGDEDEDNFSDIFSNIKANQEIINEEKLIKINRNKKFCQYKKIEKIQETQNKSIIDSYYQNIRFYQI